MNHKQETIQGIAQDVKNAGFRVFIAESGNYGFFTDKAGSRVISFQVEFLSPSFSGNYSTSNPKSTGTGWRICEGFDKDYQDIFDSHPPQWAIGSTTWKYTTLDQHLASYQRSSKYIEAA